MAYGIGIGTQAFGGFRWLSAHTANWIIFMCLFFIFEECIVTAGMRRRTVRAGGRSRVLFARNS